jgi:hypothetical protein
MREVRALAALIVLVAVVSLLSQSGIVGYIAKITGLETLPASTGSASGLVVDASNRPLAGVKVMLFPSAQAK